MHGAWQKQGLAGAAAHSLLYRGKKGKKEDLKKKNQPVKPSCAARGTATPARQKVATPL
jgi:hypothetical protein